MAAATQSYTTIVQDGQIVAHEVLAARKIFSRTPVFVKAAGYAFSNDGTIETLTNGDIFMGISTEEIDNLAGANGDKFVRVYAGERLIQLPISDTITIANKGDKVYVNDVTDNSTFTITSSAGNPQATIGNIEKFISANLARVRIKTQFVVANGA